MSKIIYICSRSISDDSIDIFRLRKVCDQLNPDNISSNSSKFYFQEGIAFGISNPTSTIKIISHNVLLGKLFEARPDWNTVKSPELDGNFGIFRANTEHLEVITDCMGTRNIWYYFDETIFIASTSQKAIIQYLGNFEFDESVIPWIISTGSLGPTSQWDKRLKRIPADGGISLDRIRWELSLFSKPVVVKNQIKNWKEQKHLLRSSIEKTFQNIEIDYSKWVITLSGGHDSRAILLLLKKLNPKVVFNTTTWGTTKSKFNKSSDAWIAQQLASKIKTNHQYRYSEVSQAPAEEIIERFLNNGEGRIDHITGYLDGFKIWKEIFQNGTEGVIRGDEVFGYNSIYSPKVVKNFMGLSLCSEFSNLKKYNYVTGLKQELPEPLKKEQGESLATWRDRIFQLYRIPFIQSALADLKYPYVEQINPFLSRKIVTAMRELSDRARTDKKLFKSVMQPYSVKIPFSKADSNMSMKAVLRQEDYKNIIIKELSSDYAKSLFPTDFLEQITENILKPKNKKSSEKGFLSNIKPLIPRKLKIYLAHKTVSLYLDEHILAFRIFIICRMHRKLNQV